ncbi:restriction endonuclease subunit S [Nibrella saemangeumensis]
MNDVQLPEGWKWVKLSEVCLKIDKTGSKLNNPADEFSYIDIDAIDNKTYTIVNPKRYSWQNAPSRAQQIVQAGDIVFSTVRTYLKNIALVPGILNNQIASTGFCVLRGGTQLHSSYLFYYVLTEQFLRPLNEIQRGTSYPAVRNSDVLDQPIPLPPLPIQRRIVERIEELFSELEAGTQELQTALKRLKTYRQAVLHHYLSNPGWERVRLGEISLKIRNGISAKPDREAGLKIFRISAVRPNHVYYDDVRFLEEKEEYSSYILSDGDLLFTRYNGSIDYTGVCAVFRQRSNDPIVHPDKLIRVTLNGQFCNPDFVCYTANSGESRTFIRSRIRTTAGQSGISGADIKSVSIPLPGLETQTRIVTEIEARLSEADAMEAAIRQSLTQAEALRQSILKRAFDGKLVSEVPDDWAVEEAISDSPTSSQPRVRGGKSEQLSLF